MQFQYQKQRIINQQFNSAFSLFDGDAGVLTHPLEQQRKQQLEQQRKQQLEQQRKQNLEQNKIEITNFIKLKMFEKKTYELGRSLIVLTGAKLRLGISYTAGLSRVNKETEMNEGLDIGSTKARFNGFNFNIGFSF